MKHLESQEQQALVRWAQYHPIPKNYLSANPNGGYRNPREAARLKLEGVRPGVSDLFLAYPTEQFHGLWIEMKRPKGHTSRLTSPQAAWLDRMKGVGYDTHVAYGWEDARYYLETYLAS